MKRPKTHVPDLKNLLSLIALMLSAASAHYLGFLMHIPFEMLSVIAEKFLADFILTFVFYATLSLTMSRVIAFSLSQVVSSETSALAALSLRLRRHWPGKFNKFGIRAFKENSKLENFSYWLILITALLFTLNFSYFKISLNGIGSTSWLIISAIITSVVFKAGFLNRNPIETIRRISDKKRVRFRKQLAQLLIRSGTGLALVFSFYSGIFRYEKIMEEKPLHFSSKIYNAQANILLSSKDKFFLVEKTSPKRYTYTDNEKTITYEEEIKSKPQD